MGRGPSNWQKGGARSHTRRKIDETTKKGKEERDLTEGSKTGGTIIKVSFHKSDLPERLALEKGGGKEGRDIVSRKERNSLAKGLKRKE